MSVSSNNVNSSVIERINNVKRKADVIRKEKKQEKEALAIQKKAERDALAQQKKAERDALAQQKKAQKDALAEQKKAQKDAEKRQKKAQKDAERETELWLKELDKETKKSQREAKKRQKDREKETERRHRERVKAAIQCEREKNKKSMRKKFEVQTKTLTNLVPVAKKASQDYPDGFTAKQLTDMYIFRYGRINPYTLEAVDEGYDIHAAIRGIMEETSPSSAQHWFRYGIQKSDEQVAPWLFANKQLAIVNNAFGWKITTSEIAKARRQNKGKWIYMIEGGNARFDWPIEKYGPLPTEDVLKEAAIGRKVGVRGRKQQES